jgi:hypothetical protein
MSSQDQSGAVLGKDLELFESAELTLIAKRHFGEASFQCPMLKVFQDVDLHSRY